MTTAQYKANQRAGFAAKAMQGILACGEWNTLSEHLVNDVAEMAVMYADALMAELDKKK